jgi:general secretion pathway protein J
MLKCKHTHQEVIKGVKPTLAWQKNVGFTLIEVLVALVVMSIMAVLTWQGIDGMAKASSQHRSRADDIATVQTALLQWRMDLDHMVDASQVPPASQGGNANTAKAIEFDSRVLRITRRYEGDEQRVVAWGSRRVETATGSTNRFMRWVSEPIRTRGQWQAAWDQAGRWGQNPGDAERARETAILAIDEWQIFYYRNDAWSNPLSADSTAATSGKTTSANPDGVRLILQLAPGQLPGGTLSMDWVQPTRAGGKS